jgi:hypothetical protein
LGADPPGTRGGVFGDHADGALGPNEIFAAVLSMDGALRLEWYYSERSVFYNPGRRAKLGTIVASIKDHDGPNDARSRLSRPGVYRFAFQLSHDAFVERFGAVPARPARGKCVHIDHDPSVLDELTPHPVYAWMRWVQVLRPGTAHFESLVPLVEESLVTVRSKWRRRSAAG